MVSSCAPGIWRALRTASSWAGRPGVDDQRRREVISENGMLFTAGLDAYASNSTPGTRGRAGNTPSIAVATVAWSVRQPTTYCREGHGSTPCRPPHQPPLL